MKKKRYLIVTILTLLTAVVIFKIHNSDPLTNDQLFNFPYSINNWKGKDIPMEAWVFQSLETPYAIMRDFESADGGAVNLAIVWYDDREIAFHAPEACLGGSGNKVQEKSIEAIALTDTQSVEIGKMFVKDNMTPMIVKYYYISDNFVTSSQINLRAHILLKKLTFQRTSAAFVRFIIPAPANNKAAEKKLKGFIKSTYPLISKFTHTNNTAL